MRILAKATEEERQQIKTEVECSGMFLSGGTPMGNPQDAVARLCRKYGLDDSGAVGFDIRTGEFVSRDDVYPETTP